MKNLFKFASGTILTSFILLSLVGFSVNSATDLGDVEVHVEGNGPQQATLVVIDTINTDLTLFSPASGKMACVMGVEYLEADAHNLMFKSGTTEHVTFQMPANSGMQVPIGNPMFCTLAGEDLVIQSSVAISKMLFYITEISKIKLD